MIFVVIILYILVFFICIKDFYTCNEEIRATLLEYTRNNIKGVITYNLKFHYNFNGSEYLCFSRQPVLDIHKYIIGDEYLIYINKKNPSINTLCRSKSSIVRGLVLLGIGIFFSILLVFDINSLM